MKTSKKIIGIFAALLAAAALSAPVFAAQKIAAAFGQVTVISKGAERDAKSGEDLAAGDKIKTAAAARAEILDGESKVWLRENSEVEISKAPQNDSIFSLLAGKLRAKVKLMQGAKFRVNTPVSVASVRGTDFAVDSVGELLVFEGAVEFGDIAAAQQPAVVEAGTLARLDTAAGGVQKEQMSATQMEAYNKEWQSPEASPEQGKAPDKKPEEKAKEPAKELKSEMTQLRNEIRNMVREIRNDIVVTRDLTNEIKQADIASGRTLKDRFGNLVRVEQQLLRPDNKTMQFVNITKRDSYKYSGFFGANTYTGPSSSRVDIFDAQIQFSEALPSDVAEWPKFFSDKGDAVKVDKTTLRLTNKTDTIESVATRQSVTKTETYTDWVQQPVYDQFGNIMYYNSVPVTRTETVTEDEMKGTMTINGWTADEDNYNSVLDGVIYPDKDLDDKTSELAMWAKSPEMKYMKAGEADKYLSVWTEFYGINNSGGLLTESSFASASSNPFAVLKEVAFQNVIFVKEVDSSKIASGKTVGDAGMVKSDFFQGRNIDLVYTPDVMVSIATKMMSKIGDIKMGSSSSDSKAPSAKSFPRL